MARVSIERLENLEELVHGLLFMHEALETSCREQIGAAESKYEEAREEAKNSEKMLEDAIQGEQTAQHRLEETRETLETVKDAHRTANSALAACVAGSSDEDGTLPDCSHEESDVADAEAAVELAQADFEQAQIRLEQAKENRQAMEQRVEHAIRALAMAEQALEQSREECVMRLATVSQSVDIATVRLTAAQQALSAYLAINPSAMQFHTWLKWSPTQHAGPVTPDTLRDRTNLSTEQRRMFQAYLYDRNPAYRRKVDKYRSEWAAARGDTERNIVARNTRIHLSGEFAEQIVRHALAPLGGRIETQGRTFVGDNGRYTKTDLIVTVLRVPVILGRGDGMGAPVGGSMAFEVKCGKAEYLYSQKDHMVFQAAGHKQADAQCTLCSRDIHDLPQEQEKELRETLREAGSPLVGMLPHKNEIDQSCLEMIREGVDEKL